MILCSSFSAKIVPIQYDSMDCVCGVFSPKIVKINETDLNNAIVWDFAAKMAPISANNLASHCMIYNSMSLSLSPFTLQNKNFIWVSSIAKIIRKK
jgi:hypothetical protein